MPAGLRITDAMLRSYSRILETNTRMKRKFWIVPKGACDVAALLPEATVDVSTLYVPEG